MELMQELKRHENVIQLLGICKSMSQLHYVIMVFKNSSQSGKIL